MCEVIVCERCYVTKLCACVKLLYVKCDKVVCVSVCEVIVCEVIVCERCYVTKL